HRLDGADLRLDVEIEGEIEVRVAHLQNGAGMDHAGAVEQHVDAADLGDGLLHRGSGKHVEQAGGDAGHAIKLGELGGIDVGGDHPGAGPGKGFHRGPANALGGGGDENSFSGEIGHASLLLSRLDPARSSLYEKQLSYMKNGC